MSQPHETLELRLTDEQIAAIRQRIAWRKRQITECGQIDLGEIDGRDDFKSYVKKKREEATLPDTEPAVSTIGLPLGQRRPVQLESSQSSHG